MADGYRRTQGNLWKPVSASLIYTVENKRLGLIGEVISEGKLTCHVTIHPEFYPGTHLKVEEENQFYKIV